MLLHAASLCMQRLFAITKKDFLPAFLAPTKEVSTTLPTENIIIRTCRKHIPLDFRKQALTHLMNTSKQPLSIPAGNLYLSSYRNLNQQNMTKTSSKSTEYI